MSTSNNVNAGEFLPSTFTIDNTSICGIKNYSSVAIEDSTITPINIVQSVIACVGIVGNLTVVVVFINDRKLRRKIPNIFIINQSAIDLMCSIILLLISHTVKDAYQTTNTGLLGDLECGIWNSRLFLWGTLVSSSWNLVCLTIERYLELVYPLWHKAYFKMKYLYASLIFSWIFGLAVASYAIPTSKVHDGKCYVYDVWPSDKMKTIFGIVIIFLQFLIPFIILVICYMKIVWMLTRGINSGIDNYFNVDPGEFLRRLLKNALKTLSCQEIPN